CQRVRRKRSLRCPALCLVGTACSVLYNTYLDNLQSPAHPSPPPTQQDPLLASKANFLNVYFIKKAWGWTSAAFLFCMGNRAPIYAHPRRALHAGSQQPPFGSSSPRGSLVQPSLSASSSRRGASASSPSPPVTPLPPRRVLPCAHTALSPATHPALFASSSSFAMPSEWRATPRLRKGHDVSGHIFLLTLSILLLAAAARPVICAHPLVHTTHRRGGRQLAPHRRLAVCERDDEYLLSLARRKNLWILARTRLFCIGTDSRRPPGYPEHTHRETAHELAIALHTNGHEV
ncbi:hypothetical protein B0H11DRAFT_2388377, partial [Mycena galericulata]